MQRAAENGIMKIKMVAKRRKPDHHDGIDALFACGAPVKKASSKSEIVNRGTEAAARAFKTPANRISESSS